MFVWQFVSVRNSSMCGFVDPLPLADGPTIMTRLEMRVLFCVETGHYLEINPFSLMSWAFGNPGAVRRRFYCLAINSAGENQIRASSLE